MLLSASASAMVASSTLSEGRPCRARNAATSRKMSRTAPFPEEKRSTARPSDGVSMAYTLSPVTAVLGPLPCRSCPKGRLPRPRRWERPGPYASGAGPFRRRAGGRQGQGCGACPSSLRAATTAPSPLESRNSTSVRSSRTVLSAADPGGPGTSRSSCPVMSEKRSLNWIATAASIRCTCARTTPKPSTVSNDKFTTALRPFALLSG